MTDFVLFGRTPSCGSSPSPRTLATNSRFACALFCLAAGCASPAGENAPPGAPEAVAPSPPADEVRAGERARWTGDCARVVREVQAQLAALPSRCETDATCVCYPGGIEGVTGCGGESDRAASARVFELMREFERLGCDYGVNCAPRRCESACVDGKCKDQRKGSIP